MREYANGEKRTISYYDKDIKYVVDAYEFACDADRSICLCEDEPEGETYYAEFNDFCSAVRKYLELKDKGWDVIELKILLVNKSKCAEFFISIYNCKTLINIYVNESNINSKLIEKISKIDKIIHE